MPVDFPTLAQRERYVRHPDIVSTAPARYFHLDDDALYRVARKRRDSGRLGYALRLTTARFSMIRRLCQPSPQGRFRLHWS